MYRADNEIKTSTSIIENGAIIIDSSKCANQKERQFLFHPEVFLPHEVCTSGLRVLGQELRQWRSHRVRKVTCQTVFRVDDHVNQGFHQ